MRINWLTTNRKCVLIWSFISFSPLILQGNVWRSLVRVCMRITGLKGVKATKKLFTCAPPMRSSFRNTLGLGSPMPFSIPFKQTHKKVRGISFFSPINLTFKVKKQNFQVITLLCFYHISIRTYLIILMFIDSLLLRNKIIYDFIPYWSLIFGYIFLGC